MQYRKGTRDNNNNGVHGMNDFTDSEKQINGHLSSAMTYFFQISVGSTKCSFLIFKMCMNGEKRNGV